jgi:hypothetical protein
MMLRTNNLLKDMAIALVVMSSSLLISSSVNSQNQPQQAIATLDNGSYQFCSKPKPQKLDGAGVCFHFTKIGDRVDGYYGYPHSDDLICLRGKVLGNKVVGEALAVSWAGREWTNIPKTEFTWDEEGHLSLNHYKIIRSSKGNDRGDRNEWILFQQATLDVAGFYRYSQPLMTTPSQLCQW